jgi:hypothetical protein
MGCADSHKPFVFMTYSSTRLTAPNLQSMQKVHTARIRAQFAWIIFELTNGPKSTGAAKRRIFFTILTN